MPAYTVTTAAVALEVEPKWLDNLLSHNAVEGVTASVQGRSRRLTLPAIRLIAIAQELVRSLSTPHGTALRTAHQLVAGTTHSVVLGTLELSADLDALDRHLAARLAYAVEVAPVPRRGRPPRQG